MGRWVHVTWLDGSAVLSLPSQCRDFSGPAIPATVAFTAKDAGTLGVAIRSAWLARRGSGPIPTEPEPWTPHALGSGVVVLAANWVGPGLLEFMTFVAYTTVSSTFPVSRLSTSLQGVGFGLFWVGVGGLLLRWWARVEVHDDTVVVRSFPFRRRCILRSAVRSITTEKSGRTLGLALHLALVTETGTVRLPAPITMNAHGFDDPDFYRIWHWLDQELCRTDLSEATVAEVTRG